VNIIINGDLIVVQNNYFELNLWLTFCLKRIILKTAA
jgi:hypothetical protein